MSENVDTPGKGTKIKFMEPNTYCGYSSLNSWRRTTCLLRDTLYLVAFLVKRSQRSKRGNGNRNRSMKSHGLNEEKCTQYVVFPNMNYRLRGYLKKSASLGIHGSCVETVEVAIHFLNWLWCHHSRKIQTPWVVTKYSRFS